MPILLMQSNLEEIELVLNKSSTDKSEKDQLFLKEEFGPLVCNHFRRISSYDNKKLSLKSDKIITTVKKKRVTTDVDITNVRLETLNSPKCEETQSKINITCESHEANQLSEALTLPVRSTQAIHSRTQSPVREIQIVFDDKLKGKECANRLKLSRKSLGIRRRRNFQQKYILEKQEIKSKLNYGQLCIKKYIGNIPNSVARDFSSDLKIKLSKAGKLSLATRQQLRDSEENDENYRIIRSDSVILGSKRKHQYSTLRAAVALGNKRNKSDNMSVYDPRLQSEDRAVGNGYVTRGLHNDENASALGNQYYPNSQPMIATLCNIGNTCYLNSVVYTLRFAPLFLHNLHHLVEDLSHINQRIGKRVKSSSLGRNIGGIHTENVRSWSSKDLASMENSSSDMPKSNQQIATEKLHELYQHLHRNELIESTEPFHADTFLRAIQEVSTIFEGNQQQDAHEFLMCVLDSIRETCQTLIKCVSECPDLIVNGLPEQAESMQSAPSKERERESSIIKTSFFSRRSKRKEDAKQPKGLRLNSPHKENLISSPQLDSLNSAIKNSLSSIITDDDITTTDRERLNEKIKQLGLDFFTEDFEGITVSTTKCLSCETITEQKETMIDIAVPISGYENVDNSEKSQFFIQNSCITREYFRGENKYRCEQCIGYTEAIRSISYEVLPRLLMIQLNRFSGGMEKINSYLPTPFTLQCFCAKCCQQPDNKKHHVYKLYSVITHVGATMSVGHYIAYTCSLDLANDYVNCPKDRRRETQLNSLNSCGNVNSNHNSSNNTCSHVVTTNASEKNIGLMKKMRFGRGKASSSSDMSKQVKSVNGVSNKTITNGVEKLNINTTCASLNCCGLRIKNYANVGGSSYNGSSVANAMNINGIYVESTDDQSSTAFSSASCYSDALSYNSNSNGKSKSSVNNQSTWYMCDDDKIKVMSQREFEELLSPNRKIMVTPYLLFYARRDLQ